MNQGENQVSGEARSTGNHLDRREYSVNLGTLNKNICRDCGAGLEPMKQSRRASGEFWQCPQCKRVWRIKNDPRQTHTTDNRQGKPL